MDGEILSSSMKGFRLPPEGKQLLEKFYIGVTKYPTASQKQDLVNQVRELLGCKDYTKQKLSIWFNTRRAKDSKQNMEKGKFTNPEPAAPVAAAAVQYVNTTHRFLYPSIPADKLELLEEVYKEHIQEHGTAPSEEIIQLWADHCGENVELKHVHTWVRKQNSASTVPGGQTRSRSQLPTPSQSTSPEPGPSSHSIHDVKNEPPMSTVINRTGAPSSTITSDFNPEDHEAIIRQRLTSGAVQYPLSPVSPSFAPAHTHQSTIGHAVPIPQTNSSLFSGSISRRSSPPHAAAPQKPPLLSVPKDLLPRLASVLSSRLTPQPEPRNVAELNAQFQTHERKMRNFMAQVSNGAHLKTGWDPSLIAPPQFLLPPSAYVPQSSIASSSNMSS